MVAKAIGGNIFDMSPFKQRNHYSNDSCSRTSSFRLYLPASKERQVACTVATVHWSWLLSKNLFWLGLSLFPFLGYSLLVMFLTFLSREPSIDEPPHVCVRSDIQQPNWFTRRAFLLFKVNKCFLLIHFFWDNKATLFKNSFVDWNEFQKIFDQPWIICNALSCTTSYTHLSVVPCVSWKQPPIDKLPTQLTRVR